MQQPQLTTDADIGEVRTVATAAACNQLLAEGWVLLAVFPVTRIGEMAEGQPSEDSSANASRTRSGMSGG
jgi:hypothetical protein